MDSHYNKDRRESSFKKVRTKTKSKQMKSKIKQRRNLVIEIMRIKKN